MIGYKKFGQGPQKILLLHDWFADSTSYISLIDQMDKARFTFVCMDMRGYGQSRHIAGVCSAEEAANDAWALIDYLKWDQFSVICHSMSALVVCAMLSQKQDPIQKIIGITPVPPCGAPVPEDIFYVIEAAALGDREIATQVIQFMTGHQQTENFVKEKVDCFLAASVPEARLAYAHMFTQTDLSAQIQGTPTPILTITGEHDAESYSPDVMLKTFGAWFKNHKNTPVTGRGHFPETENTQGLVEAINSFLLN